jgi:hypothetical protein
MVKTCSASSSSNIDLTVGRATGMESFVRDDDTEEEPTELAVFNYDKKSGMFSAKGNVVNGFGRVVGLLRAETSKGFGRSGVSYVTPMVRIKARYKSAV